MLRCSRSRAYGDRGRLKPTAPTYTLHKKGDTRQYTNRPSSARLHAINGKRKSRCTALEQAYGSSFAISAMMLLTLIAVAFAFDERAEYSASS